MRGLSDYDAVVEACRLRFRPIMMTTAAALLGAVPPLASYGDGSEIRRPLGVAIAGGLILSRLLTPLHDAGALSDVQRNARQGRRFRLLRLFGQLRRPREI